MAATIYQLRTFKDIVDAAMEELKLQATDTISRNRIKRDVNMAYLDEVAPYEQWKWLRGQVSLAHEARFNSGSCTVTQNSVAVTLTTAPATSRKGYYFSVDGQNEVYRIAQHTANSTSVILEIPFIGASAATQNFKIWTDRIPLPNDMRDAVSVHVDYRDVPLEGQGIQQFRRHMTTGQKTEARPAFYTVSDYVDPSPFSTVSGIPAVLTSTSEGLVKTIVFASSVEDYLRAGDHIEVTGALNFALNGEFTVSSVSSATITYTGVTSLVQASTADTSIVVKKDNNEKSNERFKELWIFPALYNTRCMVHIDYTKEPLPLAEDDDEPLMPIGDRTVLLYATLHRVWSRERNPEEAQRNGVLYERKLNKMAGKVDDSTDLPVLRTGKTYLAAKRETTRRRPTNSFRFEGGGATSGSAPEVVGTANTVAIYGPDGVLIGSTLVSVTELNQLDGILSKAVGVSDAQTLTNKVIDADANAISNIDNSDIKALAGIEVDKLEALTPTTVAILDASGFLASSAITPTELTYLNDFIPLTSVTLVDNQVAAANVFTYTAASFTSSIVEYSITRGAGNQEVGQLLIATDGTTVNMTQVASQLGTIGVTLTADISGGAVRVRYTSTSTGTAPTFKYIQRRWA